MASKYARQIEQISRASTTEELQDIVRVHGGFEAHGIMRDATAERALIDAGIRLYMARGLPYYQAAQGSELLFYERANPIWDEKIKQEAVKRDEQIMQQAADGERIAPLRTIDKARLKAAAEHLEWVLLQYPDSAIVRSLHRSLSPLIDAAKANAIESIVEMNDVPGAYNFGDRLYSQFSEPDVDDAYVQFCVELEGGLTDQENRQIAEMEDYRKSLLENEP